MVQDLTDLNNGLESLLPSAANPRSFQYQMAAWYSSGNYSSNYVESSGHDDDFMSLISHHRQLAQQLEKLAESTIAQRGLPGDSLEPILSGLKHSDQQHRNLTFPSNPASLSF